MKRKILILIMLVMVMAAMTATIALAAGRNDLTDVRAATIRFQSTAMAEQLGWGLVPGLDHCFQNPGVGAMGYHYINTDLLDLRVDRTRPEALVYATGPDGQLELVAVEYIVPAKLWDDSDLEGLPRLFGQTFHLNEALGVYVLHAWIWKDNPAGLFEDWNPTVSCP
jgi:hypothetical protein